MANENDNSILYQLITETHASGHRNDGGADWIQCPFCGATADVKGNACREPLISATELDNEHDKECLFLHALRMYTPEETDYNIISLLERIKL